MSGAMSTQGEAPQSRRSKIVTAVSVGAVTAVVVAAGLTFASWAHSAQVKAAAEHAMTAAAPVYQGAISLGGDLDELASKSVEAKKAFDAEQARLAAEKAAQEAAAAAAKAAADEAERQAAQQRADAQGASNDAPDSPSAPAAPVRCPAGSQANSNDGVNDTSCFPVVCFTITVPDPAHPECDVAFKP